eukprot:scaffold9009_cov58-Phaeocystis_antarctica.AAC.3
MPSGKPLAAAEACRQSGFGSRSERRPGHAPAAENASLKLALRRAPGGPLRKSMKTRGAMGQTGRA